MIALGSVVMATAASVLVVGIMMVIAGVAEVISAFQIKTWGSFFLWLLLGALYIVAGFVTFQNPLLAAAVLTVILGVALVISGIMRIILAFSMKEGTPWLWVVLSGAITLVLGFIILTRWPISSLYVLGLFLGIDLVFAGAGWIGVGLGAETGGPEPAIRRPPARCQATLCLEELTMRWFHLAVIVLLATITLVFVIQNFQIVTVSFLHISAQTPLAFLITLIYLLGALTGSSMLALLRRSIAGARLSGSMPS